MLPYGRIFHQYFRTKRRVFRGVVCRIYGFFLYETLPDRVGQSTISHTVRAKRAATIKSEPFSWVDEDTIPYVGVFR